ncbi:MAG TPA: hypothetical protein VG733_05930 [Chthoniobacteraceae bacterium]|nr:hypothetical protein [Chthoniobacteraceae bacterium]
MKWFLALFVAGAVVAGGYYFYSHRPAPQKPAAVVAPAEPLPPIASGPGPVASLMPQAPVKRFAPKGVFFLLMPVSVTSDSGVVGIGQGAKVTLVSEKGKTPKTWRVTDGQTEFDVAPDHLTNDLDIADALLKKTQDAQAAANAGLRTQQQSTSDAQQLAQQKLAAFQAALQQQQAQRLQQQAGAGQSAMQPAQPAASSTPATSGKSSSNGSVNSPFGRPQPY